MHKMRKHDRRLIEAVCHSINEQMDKRMRAEGDRIIAEMKAWLLGVLPTRPSPARKPVGRITQADVARDLGVSRKTVVQWEREQTVDGPDNDSNPYHYYRALRLDPNLRGAYETLVRSVQMYRKAKTDASKRGVRFRIAFVRFNELYMSPTRLQA